ncbi:unnamed protein product [Phytophthora lilii]|uniref:Unnamed protein product n=1 Tax=Phytophthora lilii TaxID=2077276 RepID=A0A9W6UEB0_9STRA|nr:unnamed protein product [Phytophthora lilii]
MLVVKREGEDVDECVEVMERWASNRREMDYWIPATSLFETIDAVTRCKFSFEHEGSASETPTERFCFLQLTKATTHKCDQEILWKMAQPFVAKQLPVCYIALLFDDSSGESRDNKLVKFRLSPVQITKPEVLDAMPLYVA